MSALAFHHDTQIVAGLVTRYTHTTAHKPARTKPEQRRRKSDKRDFRLEVAACQYGPIRGGSEL